MVQAAVLDGLVFDASPFGQDGLATPKVDISWGEVADKDEPQTLRYAITQNCSMGADIRHHHVNILEMNGESYRLGQSKARQDKA